MQLDYELFEMYIFLRTFLHRDASVSIQSRCCYLKFLDEGVLPISLHMTNTVFIDRAIIVQVGNCDVLDEHETGIFIKCHFAAVLEQRDP